MTSYNSEYSTLYSQSYENSPFFQNEDIENENSFSITNESSNSFQENLNPNQGFYQRENISEENSFQLSSEEINPWNSLNEEEEDKNLYFIKKDEKASNVTVAPLIHAAQQASKASPTLKFQKFIAIEKRSSKNESTQLTKKKRGRGKSTNLEKNDKIHDKFSTDNLLRKIQVHYLTFIINFINIILKRLNYEQRFFKLDYEIKKNVNKKYFDSLKNKTIGEILCNKISVKYKKQDENANKKIYAKIKDNEKLKKLLSENYLKIFKKIYYKSNKNINLKEYGLDEEILLTKPVKMFKDLLKDNETSDVNKEYQKNIIECAIQNYLPDSIFLFH